MTNIPNLSLSVYSCQQIQKALLETFWEIDSCNSENYQWKKNSVPYFNVTVVVNTFQRRETNHTTDEQVVKDRQRWSIVQGQKYVSLKHN